MGEVPTAPGFPSMGVYPQSASISNDGIFLYKPPSYAGTPMTMETPIKLSKSPEIPEKNPYDWRNHHPLTNDFRIPGL